MALRRRRRLRAAVLLVGVTVVAAGVTFVVSRNNSPGGHPPAATDGGLAARASTTSPAVPLPAQWHVAWGSAMAWAPPKIAASNTTVRELATVGIGGTAVRVRISNAMGDAPLDVGAVTVAEDQSGASVVPASMQQALFGGQPATTVPIGQVTYSDPVSMTVTSGETLAVSVYVSNSDTVTQHACCAGYPDVSYFRPNGVGNVTTAPTGDHFYASPIARWVDAVDVLSPPVTPVPPARSSNSSAFENAMSADPNGSIVVVGDSLTDGYNATMRWTEVLQKRIEALPPSEQRAIVNEGISANTLTNLPNSWAKTGGGPAGLDRLAMDALDQSGVAAVVIFLGTNDLFFGADATQVIAGLQQAAAAIHQAGKEAIVATLTPRTAGPEPWSSQEQSDLEQVNQWILTSHVFDSVVNFASVIAAMYNGQCSPTSMFAPYNSGDNLHPNNAGQTAMGDAVTGPEIGLPQLPAGPALVQAVPTAGCKGVEGIPAVGRTS